jgi:hypothetical protein
MTQPSSYPQRAPVRPPNTDYVPTAVTLVVGGLLLVVATLGCDLLNLSLAQSLAVSVLVAAASSVRARLPAAAYVGVMAFALFNAFVEDREGILTFHISSRGARRSREGVRHQIAGPGCAVAAERVAVSGSSGAVACRHRPRRSTRPRRASSPISAQVRTV